MATLHLKKELTQIRKAARVLKDPGTSSSWKHHKATHVDGNFNVPLQFECNDDNVDKSNMILREKESRVLLCNWKRRGFENSLSEEVDTESLSDDARNGGVNSYSSAIFKCKEACFAPSIRKKRSKKNRLSGSRFKICSSDRSEKLRICSRYPKHGRHVLPRKRDDFTCFIGESEYRNNEDPKRDCGSSPFLSGFNNHGHKKDDDSVSLSTPALSTSSYAAMNPHSVVDSWDAATGSINYADDEIDDDHLHLPGRYVCGIPCYWSKNSTPKSTGRYGTCSSALSDALRSSIVSRSQHCETMVQTLVPLLSNGHNRQRESFAVSKNIDDDTSMELDLEALNGFDGRRLSSSSYENTKSLSHKYRPVFFDELVGQNTVVESLVAAVFSKRVAPIYLFQGPRGTGKTSTARIFAAALNCLAIDGIKPCGVCRKCDNFVSGKASYLTEYDGSNSKWTSKMVRPSTLSTFKVFVIKECHLLSSKTWLSFLHLLEKPLLPHVVFIFITTDADNVPHMILSKSEKHVFTKLGSDEIIARLAKICADENFDIDADALDLIVSNADGSLRDAETILEQLSFLGKRITVSLVNDLMGVVSDEILLELLEIAMSSNAMETVIRSRELLDSGVDPMVVISQMTSLIGDIIAASHRCVEETSDPFLNGLSLTEEELNRLNLALSLLSDAEKHIRISSERSTWFTATLLQLGSLPGSDRSQSGSSRRQTRNGKLTSPKLRPASAPRSSTSRDRSTLMVDDAYNDIVTQVDWRPKFRCMNFEMLNQIWVQCIQKCHSKTLRQLLHENGSLVSISDIEGGLVAQIAFGDRILKTRADYYLSSITNSLEAVLRRNVEVKIILLPKSKAATGQSQHGEPVSANATESCRSEESNKHRIPVKRIESITHEQRLESAWLQGTEKGTPVAISPEKKQVLPQNGEYNLKNAEQWGDELNHEIKALSISDTTVNIVSPSLLHNTSFASNFTIGYESGAGGAGCGGLFCRNNRRVPRRIKARQGEPTKKGWISCFGQCGKTRELNRC